MSQPVDDNQYNEFVDGTDYALIDNAFNGQGAPLGGLANVPEPTSVMSLGAAAGFGALLTRQRRRALRPGPVAGR